MRKRAVVCTPVGWESSVKCKYESARASQACVLARAKMLMTEWVGMERVRQTEIQKKRENKRIHLSCTTSISRCFMKALTAWTSVFDNTPHQWFLFFFSLITIQTSFWYTTRFVFS